MTGILMMSVGNSYGSLPVNTVAPVVSGTATVGQTLSTTDGTWTGAPAPTFTYQWQRGVSNISGATSSTYVLQSADAGNTVRCVVTATNALGAVSANSNSTASVTQIPANTVAPVVSGTAQVPNVLSTTNGTWTGTPTPTFTYQWQRNTTNIGGATASTYTLQVADVGNTVRCVVTGTNSAGAVSANSNSTATIAAAPTFISATTSGATETTSGNYKIATFNGSGSFTVSSVGSGSAESNTIEYLVVAGGGAGGGESSGGGAGGLLANGTNNQAVTAQTYTVTVGAGGPGSGASAASNSSISGVVTAIAGGSLRAGSPDGGSGTGGGARVGFSGPGGSGTAGQGNNGGNGNFESRFKGGWFSGGGGGGRGSAGTAGSANSTTAFGGNGGSGFTSTITGSSVAYAGGGGGGVSWQGPQTPIVVQGTGGSGGGGNGGGNAGAANRGGGGGGSIGSGGSGIVVIRWRFQ